MSDVGRAWVASQACLNVDVAVGCAITPLPVVQLLSSIHSGGTWTAWCVVSETDHATTGSSIVDHTQCVGSECRTLWRINFYKTGAGNCADIGRACGVASGREHNAVSAVSVG